MIITELTLATAFVWMVIAIAINLAAANRKLNAIRRLGEERQRFEKSNKLAEQMTKNDGRLTFFYTLENGKLEVDTIVHTQHNTAKTEENNDQNSSN